jgi:hypothetical protein
VVIIFCSICRKPIATGSDSMRGVGVAHSVQGGGSHAIPDEDFVTVQYTYDPDDPDTKVESQNVIDLLNQAKGW